MLPDPFASVAVILRKPCVKSEEMNQAIKGLAVSKGCDRMKLDLLQ